MTAYCGANASLRMLACHVFAGRSIQSSILSCIRLSIPAFHKIFVEFFLFQWLGIPLRQSIQIRYNGTQINWGAEYSTASVASPDTFLQRMRLSGFDISRGTATWRKCSKLCWYIQVDVCR